MCYKSVVINGSNSIKCKNLNHIYFCAHSSLVYSSLKSELISIGQQFNEGQLLVVSHIKDILNNIMREYNNPPFSMDDIKFML